MSDPFVETWWDDDELLIKIQYTEDRSEVFIHHDLKCKLTPSRYRRHSEILQGVCEELKEMGYSKLYALSPCQSDKWKKLCTLFKFKELTNPNGVCVFVKEI
jgi:hypothetical protein